MHVVLRAADIGLQQTYIIILRYENDSVATDDIVFTRHLRTMRRERIKL